MSESLERDGVGVTLEWTLENYYETETQYYNISINQNMAETHVETTLQLVASYDTSYNVSIMAIPLCGQRIVTTTIELYYGKYIIFMLL